MKKILSLFFLTLFLSSNSFAGSFYKRWGVVVDATPIYQNQVLKTPYYKKTCSQNHQHPNKFGNILIGGLIGSVIGNKLSDNHGAGTIGAVFGSLAAADYNNNNVSQSCQYTNDYIVENRSVFSHYKIKVRTKRGFRTLNSEIKYNIHDIIYFN